MRQIWVFELKYLFIYSTRPKFQNTSKMIDKVNGQKFCANEQNIFLNFESFWLFLLKTKSAIQNK